MFQFVKKLFSGSRLRVGLLPLSPDDRDLQASLLGWGHEYTPKKISSGLKPLSVKSQLYNSCSFNAAAGMKEMDEGVPLSARFLVAMGRKLGLITGDGFANLRAAQSILQKYGCPPAASVSNDENHDLTWEQFSNSALVSDIMLSEASQHKTKSFWFMSNHSQVLQALDEGHSVEFGVSWRRSMNMNGGFSVPWLLNFLLGEVVGGHAIYAYDWNLDYQNKRVFKCRNSFGATYGDKGDMYISFEDFDRETGVYGAVANLDIPRDVGAWLKANNGKAVKALSLPDVYLIENGKKRKFPDMATVAAHGFTDEVMVSDTENMLTLIPDGEIMNFWQGNNVLTIKMLLLRQPDLKSIFSRYFSEMFSE